jgi:hypothetical protein
MCEVKDGYGYFVHELGAIYGPFSSVTLLQTEFVLVWRGLKAVTYVPFQIHFQIQTAF